MPTWVAVIIALILIGTMAGTSYWFYNTYRTPPRLTHAGALAPSAEPGATPSPSPDQPAPTEKHATTAQITALQALQQADPQAYKAEASVYRFRSSSGNEVCAYSDHIENLADDRWVVLAPTGDEPPLQGPGLACSLVRGVNLPAEDDRRSCPDKSLAGRAATLTTSFVGYGACLDGYNPATEDARLEQNKRMSEIPQVANGSALLLGNRFLCGSLIPEFTCVDLQTGRGFGVGPAQYDLFAPAETP